MGVGKPLESIEDTVEAYTLEDLDRMKVMAHHFSIDMYPGGFNTRYGSAIGGIVEIKGRPAKTDRWHGTADVNLLDGPWFMRDDRKKRSR